MKITWTKCIFSKNFWQKCIKSCSKSESSERKKERKRERVQSGAGVITL